MFTNIEFHFTKKQMYMPSPISNFINTSKTEVSDMPIYYRNMKVRYKSNNYFAIAYYLFYSMNPGYTCCMKRFGQHNADIEYILILLNENTKQPEHVYFSAHGTGQGTWLPWNKCNISKDGNLCVYVSPESNANYPFPKLYKRIFGVANDNPKGGGRVWKPKQEDYHNAHKQSWSYKQFQIVNGINNPINVKLPTESSISNRQRFLLAFSSIQKELKQQPRIQLLEEFQSL